MSSTDYGSRRLVVGAHYGLRDWLAQRATAVILAAYTLFLLAYFVACPVAGSYDSWHALFAGQAMKVFTFVAVAALLWHVWVGIRDIWMDYVGGVAVRLSLQVLTIVWLVGCAGWAVQVLWRT